jgi:hypothetical protein
MLIVKNNQPRWRAESALGFTLPLAGDRQESPRTGYKSLFCNKDMVKNNFPDYLKAYGRSIHATE